MENKKEKRIPKEGMEFLAPYPNQKASFLQSLDLQLSESTQESITVKFKTHGGLEDMYYVNKTSFVRWVNQVQRELRDHYGFDPPS